MSDEYFTNLVNRNIFENLLTHENNSFIPVIANYWHNVDEQLTIVRARENVRFSDGDLLTAADIIKSLERALQHPKSRLYGMVEIDSMVPRPNNYLYIYNHSLKEIINFLSSTPIYKATYLDYFSDDYLSENPLSTGEYYLYSQNSQKIVLKKNKYHRNYDINRDRADIVELIYEPSLETQYQMLRNKEVDFLLQPPFSNYRNVYFNNEFEQIERINNSIIFMMLNTTSNVPPEIYRASTLLTRTSNLEARTTSLEPQTSLFTAQATNQQTTPSTKARLHKDDGAVPLTSNPLKDRRVRQAMVYALDMRNFIQSRLMGKANLLVIPASFSLKDYPFDMEYYKYDLELSKALMTEAGHANGFDMRLRIKDDIYAIELASFVRDRLKEININIIIDKLNESDFEKSLATKPASAIITDYKMRYNDKMADVLWNIFYNTGSERGSLNIFGTTDMRVNALIDSLASINDFDRRVQQISNRLSGILFNEVYVIPFINPYNLYVFYRTNAFDYKENFLFSNFRIGQ
jgi:ABC-type transport system substrate-binding protein